MTTANRIDVLGVLLGVLLSSVAAAQIATNEVLPKVDFDRQDPVAQLKEVLPRRSQSKSPRAARISRTEPMRFRLTGTLYGNQNVVFDFEVTWVPSIQPQQANSTMELKDPEDSDERIMVTRIKFPDVAKIKARLSLADTGQVLSEANCSLNVIVKNKGPIAFRTDSAQFNGGLEWEDEMRFKLSEQDTAILTPAIPYIVPLSLKRDSTTYQPASVQTLAAIFKSAFAAGRSWNLLRNNQTRSDLLHIDL